jgi:hypothetical protein
VSAHSHSSAVDVPSPRVLPIVAGMIAAVAVIGFVLGLKAGDRGSPRVIGAAPSTDPAVLAGARNAAPIIINPTETAPPPPKVEVVEEPEEAEAPPQTEAPPPVTTAPQPLAVPPPEVAAPPPPVAEIY